MKCGKKLKLQSDSGFGSLNIDTALVKEKRSHKQTEHFYIYQTLI